MSNVPCTRSEGLLMFMSSVTEASRCALGKQGEMLFRGRLIVCVPFMLPYLNSATIIGFVGADPEQRQARNNGSKLTVLSIATQRSWKNAEDEWVSKVEWHRIAIFRPRLAESVPNSIKKGAHVLVEGELVRSTYGAQVVPGFIQTRCGV